MIYKLKCETKLKSKWVGKTDVEPTITICVEICESGAFAYGNGKGLIVQVGNTAEEYFDIRYDIKYNQMSELEYVKAFVKEYAHVYLIFEISQILGVSIYE